jgi:hypothetical protein
MSEEWKLEGAYIKSYNCEVACPRVFLSAPTEGDCTVIVGWHMKDT